MVSQASRPFQSPDRKAKARILLIASMVSSLIMLDSNIVAVSLPSIAKSLGATFADIEWVVSAYVLTFAALLLAAGSFADRHGRKISTLIGLVIFTIASGLCGLSSSALMLNLARAFQGIGSALLLTSSTAVINQAFSGADRAKAYAFWGASLGIAITIGPIVGGVITENFGWRAAFLINLPVGVALFLAAVAVLTESSDHEAKRLDIPGIITFSFGLFLLIWALIGGNSLGWGAPAILWRLAGATVFLGSFVMVESMQARPMIDLSLFKRSDFIGAVFAMLGYSAGAQVLIFFLPLFLQNVFGYSPMVAGLAMLPFAFPMFLTPRVGARLSGRYSGRTILTAGLAITASGDLLLAALALVGASYPAFFLGMLVAGIGAGLLNSETAKALQGAVPVQRSGMASGLSATTRFVGLLLGVAIFGALLSHCVTSAFRTTTAALGLSPTLAAEAARRVSSGDLTGAIAGASNPIQDQFRIAATTALSDGFAIASLAAAAIAGVAGALTFWLIKRADFASELDEVSRVPRLGVGE